MANYEAAFRDLENPVSEDYKPWPDGNMTLDDLKSNRNYIWARRTMWNERWPSGKKKEKANMTKIIAALDAKTAAYDKAIAGYISTVISTGTQAAQVLPVPDPVHQQTTGNNDPILLTALPGIDTPPSQTLPGNTVTPAVTTTTTTKTVDPVTGQTVSVTTVKPAATTTSLTSPVVIGKTGYSIPKWAIYTGIGLVAFIVIAAVVKKN